MTLAETLKSDLDAFMHSDEFAVAFSYQLAAGGSPVTLSGLFDNASTQVDDLGSVAVAIDEATLTCNAAKLPNGYAEGDLVTVAGRNFKVCAPPKPDGQGVVALQLELV